MEDDKTTTEESVDTSTNEEAPDTDVDTPLEDMEVSFDDVEDDETEEAEDSEDENTDTEPAEPEEESEEDEPEVEEPEADKEIEEDTTSKEDLKRRNAEMAQRRIAEKQAREQAKSEQQSKYLDDAEDAKDLALRQLQVDAYNNRVDKHRNTLENGIEKAVASIDLFRDGSPVVKEQLARALDTFDRLYVQYDTNGDPVNVTGDVYQYLQNEADSIRTLIQDGARGQSKAKEKAKARTETLPTRAPKEPKVDPDLAEFDKAWAELK